MAMTTNVKAFEEAGLVLVVGEDGLFEWSSTHSDREVARILRSIADDIAAGSKGR